MPDTPSLSRLLSQQEQIDLLNDRVTDLEQAIQLLAKHVGAVGWNYELQKALDLIRERSY